MTAAIVSGRSRDDLERWFGHLPDLWLVGEHGAYVRSPITREWEMARPQPGRTSGSARVLPVLEHFIDRTPGSFLEEKELALVWHHRLADPEFGEWLANELVATLDEMLADTELQAIRGNKTVEVRFAWAHKGAVVDRLQALRPDADFRLAIGDDRTDEDLFQHLRGESAWTVRVGEGHLVRPLLRGFAYRRGRVPGSAGQRGGGRAARGGGIVEGGAAVGRSAAHSGTWAP